MDDGSDLLDYAPLMLAPLLEIYVCHLYGELVDEHDALQMCGINALEFVTFCLSFGMHTFLYSFVLHTARYLPFHFHHGSRELALPLIHLPSFHFMSPF